MFKSHLNNIPENELAKLAKNELNEDPARLKADIKHIKEWMKKQPHLAKSARIGKVTSRLDNVVVS